MKKFLALLIILGAAIGIAFMMQKQSASPAVPEVSIPVTAQTPVDGTYVPAPGTTVLWKGDRPLVAGYLDSGTLALESGTITVSDGTLSGEVSFAMNTITAVQTGSGKGAESLTRHLQSPDFFDAATYPRATLTITGITPTEQDHRYTAVGTLSIKGVSKPFSFPISVYDDNGALRVQGTVAVDRTQWNITYGSGNFFKELGEKMINDIFTVTIDTAFQKQ